MTAKWIKCLGCGGKGWVARRHGDGNHYPYECKACSGSGKQTVRK